MKILKKSLLVFAIVALSASYCPAMAENYNYAVVDVNKVIAESSQVKALKKEQQKKISDLEKWLKTVKADIEKQKTQEAKEKLVSKYDSEFGKKQLEIKKNYAEKLQAIDTNISNIIAKEAKDNGYQLVLPSNVVLYSDNDITDRIIKLVK